MPNHIDKGGEWDSTFTLVEPGYYRAAVKEAVAKKSQSGNDMVEMVVELRECEYDGVTIYHHLVFKPDEAENFNNKKRRWFQESAGLKFDLNQTSAGLAKAILGRKVTVKVKNREQGGQMRNDIVGVHAYDWESEDRAGSVAKSEGDDINLEPDTDFF